MHFDLYYRYLPGVLNELLLLYMYQKGNVFFSIWPWGKNQWKFSVKIFRCRSKVNEWILVKIIVKINLYIIKEDFESLIDREQAEFPLPTPCGLFWNSAQSLVTFFMLSSPENVKDFNELWYLSSNPSRHWPHLFTLSLSHVL